MAKSTAKPLDERELLFIASAADSIQQWIDEHVVSAQAQTIVDGLADILRRYGKRGWKLTKYVCA